MIEFKGELSEQSKRHFIKDLRKKFCIVMTIYSNIMCLPIVVLLSIYLHFTCAFLIVIPTIMCTVVFLYEMKDAEYIKNFAPESVTIDDNTLIGTTSNHKEVRMLTDVKRVLDYGIYYWIKVRFRLLHRGDVFACQKDLMTQGTIEEFEELFKDKLVRKEISVSENSVGMEPPVEKVVERRNTEPSAEQPKSRRWDIVIFVMTFIFGIANVALSTVFYVRGKQEYIVSLALASLGIVITALLLILYCKRKPKVGASGMTAYSLAALIFITVATITFVIPILV